MIGFVIPVAPKDKTSNWSKSTELLRRTISSILNQSSSNFRIYVVFEDRPEIDFSSEKIIQIQLNLKGQKASHMSDYHTHVRKHFKLGYEDIMLNKGIKLTRGCAEAKNNRCTHVMCVDSDDLIADDIAAFVEKNPLEYGWYIDRGYTWNEGRSFLLRHNSLTGINGSTHIIRTDLIPCDFHSKFFYDYTLFESHGYTKKRLFRENGVNLKPFSTRGVIVVKHNGNASNDYFKSPTNILKNAVKFILYQSFFGKSLRRKFGLINSI